jgi:hypothetical protein
VHERYLGEVAMGSSVYVRDGYNVRSRCKRLQNVGRGGGTGTESERIAGMLEGSDCGLEVVTEG